MRAVIIAFAGGVALVAISAEAAPNPTKAALVSLGAALSVELAAQGCG